MKKDKHATPISTETEEPTVAAANAQSGAAPDAGAADVADEVTSEPTQAPLEQLRAEAAANWEKYLRSTADLENYRKRALREKEDLARSVREQVVAALLPVLDNLERAIVAAREHGAPDSALLEGVEHTHKQFKRTLEEFGLEEVVAHAGHPFDPNWHEAVGHVESTEHPEGAILDQLQRGYKLTDRLLRPARVVVSKGKPTDPAPAGDTES